MTSVLPTKSKSAGPAWLWQGVFLMAAAIAVYLPALQNGFVWDDGSILTRNVLIPDPHGLWRIWLGGASVDYFPLTFTSFWIEWHLWGMNPCGYHAVNILLHAANTLLVWRVLLRLRIPGAWLAALIFAVHPVNVATVAWIAERKNTLSMVFYLTALLWYLRFLEVGKRGAYLLALGMFFLALLAKTSVVMLPVILLLVGWWQKGKITVKDGLRTIPFVVLSLAMGMLTVWFQNHRAIGGESIPLGDLFTRPVAAAWAIGFYLFKLLLPVNLSMLYPHWRVDQYYGQGILSLVVLVGISIWAVLYRRAWGRPVLFGFGYFLISLFPVLGFFQMYYFRLSPVADQWQYVAGIGIIALAVAAGAAILVRFQKPWPGQAVAVLVVAMLGAMTWTRASVLRNGETLWENVLKQDPASWAATVNLALIDLQQGKTKEALALPAARSSWNRFIRKVI